ncbi:DUF4082 domain-containing protein [Actinoplanes sp. NPDC051494]|uniref:DUF4082 domain-containing protein n=1 Tax=Actinoplanes sp. NPDC051494 TaxID=3363907 RepID=UPI00379D8CBB
MTIAHRGKIVFTAAAVLLLLVTGVAVAWWRGGEGPAPVAAVPSYSFFGATDGSGATTGPDARPVELGLRFTSRSAGQLTAVRFLTDGGGPHTVSVWSGNGDRLATGTATEAAGSGWQQVPLTEPLAVEPGREYVVSYHTTGYRVSQNYFADRAAEAGPLSTVGAGVFEYGDGGFPARTASESNYWVDVVFTGLMSPSVPPQAVRDVLDLPPIPWEGGPEYYATFPVGKAASWTDPDFFPIGVWYEGVQAQEDVDKDKAAGLNTYVMLTADSDMGLIERAGMHAMTADRRPDSGAETTAWIINDEVDMWAGAGAGKWTGKYPGEGDVCASGKTDCGFDVMTRLSAGLPSGDGRMRYANFGKGVMFWQSDADASKFVNGYTTVVSNDIYWYTDPNVCYSASEGPRLGITASTCRRAANYGLTMDRMREIDAMDGRRQPVYAFVEVGHPFEQSTAPTITPEQTAGAVVNSLIHEARGVLYFNHNFGGPCVSQHVLRDACGDAVRPVVTELNRRVTSLAPVLNSPSYEWRFADGLDTMLKAHDGSYYVFAMPGRTGGTGEQKLTLPLGLSGTEAEVLFENRKLPITMGAFTDTFAEEFSYHVYRIRPSG